jgi:chromosome segregation ATPase
MTADERTFRTAAFGGFNRVDVIAFLQKTARDHKQEVDQLRSVSDKLRVECNDYKRQNETLIATRPNFTQAQYDELTLLLERVTREVSERDAKIATLELKNFELAHVETDLVSSRTEVIALASKLAEATAQIEEVEREIGSIGNFRTRISEVETAAFRRAESIEEEARLNAQEQKSKATKAVADIHSRVGVIQEDTAASIVSTLSSLDEIRDQISSLNSLFKTLDEQFRELDSDPKPVIRDFVPEDYAE